MPETQDVVEQIKEQDQAATSNKFADPYKFLETIPNSPSKDQIAAWKMQTPNGRLRVFTPDAGKRVFILRAISGVELQKLQAQLPENITPQKAELELHYMVGALCTLWVNNKTGKLLPDDLRNGSAGLPSTLFALISYLSDFVEPAVLDIVSAEL